jgi:hypothetical protein
LREAYAARNDLTPQGVIEVTTLDDTNLADDQISLREALHVSNGTLSSGFSAAERARLEAGGCIFNAANAIVAGCGRGVTDTVAITSALEGRIRLIGALPSLADTAPTYLRAPRMAVSMGARAIELTPAVERIASAEAVSAPITLDASSAAGVQAVLVITSTDSSVEGFELVGAPRGLRVLGDGARIVGVRAYSTTLAGIHIDGARRSEIVDSEARPPLSLSDCSAGRNAVGVLIDNGATDTSALDVAVGCTSTGVVIRGGDTLSNTLASVSVGSRRGFTNTSDGIVIDGAAYNRLLYPSIYVSNTAGVAVNAVGAIDNRIVSAAIYGARDGVVSGSGASRTIAIGGLFYQVSRLPIDMATPAVADPPTLRVTSIDPSGRVISGDGATPGAFVFIYRDLGRGSISGIIGFSEAFAVAAADGTWRVTIDAPFADELVTRCFLPQEVTLSGGATELGAQFCGYRVLMPLASRGP